MPILQTTMSVIFFSRPFSTPPLDWREIAEHGPGPIHIPDGEEYSFRLRTCDDHDLSVFIREVEGLTPITYANLSENRNITDEGMPMLKAFPLLTSLNLSACSLTSKGLSLLPPFDHLETLDLGFCNRLMGVALKSLNQYRSLKLVNLKGCAKLTHGDVARLRRPGLEILY
jgi:hypothetical protein